MSTDIERLYNSISIVFSSPAELVEYLDLSIEDLLDCLLPAYYEDLINAVEERYDEF